jgi:hydrogenase expression/formation protein HypE
LETGLDTGFLSGIVHSMAETAREAGVKIVAGDTKVIEGSGGVMINTSGVGIICHDKNISSANVKCGDSIIVSGYLGEHHATILSTRLEITNDIKSDNAPLNDMVSALLNADINIHAMRDVTRGGLATVLKEIAVASKVKIEIEDKLLPVPQNVKDFGGLLGLDPLYMGNEGKMAFVVPEAEAEEALKIIRSSKYGENAAVIGKVVDDEDGTLLLKTTLGGLRQLDVLQGEGLPRIC